MKKFIAAFDGLKFSESTMQYAIFLAKKCNAHLVGVFLEDVLRHTYSMADITSYEGSDFDKHVHDLDVKDDAERNQNRKRFKASCDEAGINYAVHRDRNVAIQELLHESIYADLLIISSAETLTRYDEPVPTNFLREVLSEVQCPVMIVPPAYQPFNEYLLLYDGEPSSVYAIKSFSYLFESMKHFPVEVITVKGIDESLHFPDNRLIREFLKRHFPEAHYVALKGKAEDEVIRYLSGGKKNPLIIMGAYRRTRLSRMFRPSMADSLLKHMKVPLFIAHNKS